MFCEDYSELKLPKRKLQELNERLTGCEYCHSTYDREDHETYFYEPHESFYDLLEDIGFSDEQKEIIYQNISCPNCGCDLDAYSEITENEYFREERYHRQFIEKIANNAETKIKDFYNFLIKYPYLGCKHAVGKQIIKGIDSLEKINFANQVFFRAREPKDSRIFDNNDMLPPNPQNIPISEGRFNHFGQGHWYLGDSIDLCGAECSHKKNCVLWFQKVEIEQATDILDLAKDYIYNYFNPDNIDGYSLPIAVAALLWSGILTKEQQIKGFWKPEYFITRYIADICKEKGINGIIYPSSLYSSGRNLVIFDINKIKFKFDGKPELKEYKYDYGLDDLEF